MTLLLPPLNNNMRCTQETVLVITNVSDCKDKASENVCLHLKGLSLRFNLVLKCGFDLSM